MGRANLSKHLVGLFIFICVMCLFPAFLLAADGPTLADLTGTWNFNACATGSDSPWWERGTITVASDGKFSGGYSKQSDGKVKTNSTGSFSISSAGIRLSVNGKDNLLCQINSYNTVLSCTETWSDGSTSLTILTKQAASYSKADLAGTWQLNYLMSGPEFGWGRGPVETGSDGKYTGTLTLSDGSKIPTSGQLSISPTGTIKCVKGDCLDFSNLGEVMDAGKTVIVATSGASSSAEPALLYVFTKEAASYSKADLAGTWEGNSLASGPGAPFWDRISMTLNSAGTGTGSSYDSLGGTHKKKSMSGVKISSNGVVSFPNIDSDTSAVMDASKTVIIYTSTWAGDTDPGTTDLVVFTKVASVPRAPTIVKVTPGNEEATVSFTPPALNGNSAITSYTVTATPGKHKVSENVSTTKKFTPITMKGLTSGTPYKFTVTATNAMGTSPASTSITATPR